jgi:hypothetical protein
MGKFLLHVPTIEFALNGLILLTAGPMIRLAQIVLLWL